MSFSDRCINQRSIRDDNVLSLNLNLNLRWWSVSHRLLDEGVFWFFLRSVVLMVLLPHSMFYTEFVLDTQCILGRCGRLQEDALVEFFPKGNKLHSALVLWVFFKVETLEWTWSDSSCLWIRTRVYGQQVELRWHLIPGSSGTLIGRSSDGCFFFFFTVKWWIFGGSGWLYKLKEHEVQTSVCLWTTSTKFMLRWLTVCDS